MSENFAVFSAKSSQYLRWFHYLLNEIGIKSEKSRKVFDGVRENVQNIDIASIEKMALLSLHIRQKWSCERNTLLKRKEITHLIAQVESNPKETVHIVGNCFSSIIPTDRTPRMPRFYNAPIQTRINWREDEE